MTSLSDLQTAYSKLLAGHAPVASAAQADDAFEVYTLALVLRAAKEEGATIGFQSSQGISNPVPLRFRTSPGRIYSLAHDYSHATIEFDDGLDLEAHIGVYVEGVAGVIHECDVLVIRGNEGRFCRRNGVHPKRANTVLTAECKFYAGTLGIALGRQFLGVTSDLGSTGRFLVSNSDGSSVDRILAHHHRKRALGLSPLDSDAEMQAVAQFRGTFHDLRSKRR